MTSFTEHTKQSGASLLVSLGVHLTLLLLLSFLLLDSRVRNSIFLDLETTSRTEELETQVAFVLEFPEEKDAVSIDSQLLSASAEESVEMDADQLIDFSALDYNASPNSDDSNQLNIDPSDALGTVKSTGFFGIEATGNRIVYVIDMSPSMQQGNYQRRYDRAVAEVMRSVEQLRPDQEFYVYLFCFRMLPMDIGKATDEFCIPTRQNKDRLHEWLKSIRLGPGTDPRETLVAALKKEPTCVFLLSDGEFNGMRYRNGSYRNRVTAVELAQRYNKSKCPIHTIGLENEDNQADMTLIAKESGGQYQFVPAEF